MGALVKTRLEVGLKGAPRKECICYHNPSFPNTAIHINTMSKINNIMSNNEIFPASIWEVWAV